MNLNLYYHQGTWIMVDCGMMIHTSDEGVDQILVPEIGYLRDKELSALILTHAHEDHIGAITDLWMELKCPIYATPFTAAVVRRKLGESKISERVPLEIHPSGGRFSVGPFDCEFIPVTHSTVESQSVVLRTDAGVVVHTGDWKLDPQPLVGVRTAESRLQEVGREGVLAVVGDSTNASIEGWSGSESKVKSHLETLISKQTGRVVGACFSSNIARVMTFLDIASKTGRHPVLVGRSLKRMVSAAQEVGYIPRIDFVPPHEAMYLPAQTLLLICTGSQGEPRAALTRIAQGDHRDIYLEGGDSIFFSSKIIPGNEEGIQNLQEAFRSKGVNVISEEDEFIHVSGHPCVEELKQMYAWLKPRILIPVHGYPKHLKAHAEVGRDCQVPHVVEVYNGDLTLLSADDPHIVEEVSVGRRVRIEEPPPWMRHRKGRNQKAGRGSSGRMNFIEERTQQRQSASNKRAPKKRRR